MANQAEQVNLTQLELLLRSTYKELTGLESGAEDSIEEIFRKSLSFLYNLLDQMPGLVYWQNKENIFLGCNSKVAKNAGLISSKQIVGKSNYDFPWREQADQLNQLNNLVMQTRRAHKVEEFVYTVENPEGKFYLSEKTPLIGENGELIGVLGVSLDITDKKKLEEELKIANQLKIEFIQNMQHDLRTPTAGSMIMLENLAAKETDLEKKQELIMLYNSAKRIYTICNEIVDFDHIAQHRSPVLSKKFNLYQLIQEIIELNHPAARIRNLKLTYFIDPLIPKVLISDPKRLSRILINLIGNAIKFTEKGSVKLEVKPIDLSKQQKILLEFQVSDTGIGIPEDKKDLIYEQFSRLSPANQSYQLSSGLGLNIVKHYIQDLKGEIEVRSQVGKGSTFFITFALQRPLNEKIHDETVIIPDGLIQIEPVEKEQIVQAINMDTQQNELQILLVEDHRMTMVATLMAIRDAKISAKPTMAENFTAAIKLLREKKFDLVISDLGLPDGDGCDIPRIIKANPQELNYHTLFFALTAHSDYNKRKETESAGFTLMLNKPLTSTHIKSLVDEYIHHKFDGKMPRVGNDTQIISLELGEKLIGQVGKTALQLLNILAAELPRDISLIQAAVERSDIESLRSELHKFKGALAYCGVPRLQAVIAELEQSARATNTIFPLEKLLSSLYKEAKLFLELHQELSRESYEEEPAAKTVT